MHSHGGPRGRGKLRIGCHLQTCLWVLIPCARGRSHSRPRRSLALPCAALYAFPRRTEGTRKVKNRVPPTNLFVGADPMRARALTLSAKAELGPPVRSLVCIPTEDRGDEES